MPRARDDMQVNVAGLRRNIKNLAHNYSDAQVKVREATSNDPWGPSSTLMAEIADLTYNVMAFTEIMQMIWKRLNDHGKNWRHVYKALVLMEYLIKTGSEKVAMQCRENIYAIQTLKDFQYMEEGKDQGLNVREKAKQLGNLLRDEERLKNERARALKAKQRFAQSASAFGSDGALDTPSSPTYPALSGSPAEGVFTNGSQVLSSSPAEWTGRESELARPLTAGEEELQLQLALAMSREEAEREERRRRSDDVRLQLAISQSQTDFKLQQLIRSRQHMYFMEEVVDANPKCWLACIECTQKTTGIEKPSQAKPEQQSHLLDLLDVNLSPQAPHSHPQHPPGALGGVGALGGASALDPWGLPSPPAHVAVQKQSLRLDFRPVGNTMDTSPDAWSSVASPARDPWAPAAPADPWAPVSQLQLQHSKSPVSILSSPSSSELEQFDALSQRRNNNVEADPFDLSALGDNLTPKPTSPPLVGSIPNTGAIKKSPSAFLGENSSLVNLERLLQPAPPDPPAPNPFANEKAPQPVKLSINEIKQQQMGLNPGLSFTNASPAFGAPIQPNHMGVMPAEPLIPLGVTGVAGMAGVAGVTGVGSSDPWAPARSSSPWSPPATRHTPNPFLS